jgi:hypothetical protein
MLNPEKPQSLNYRSYQIYALIDPRDNLVHYVGISVDAQIRFNAHIYLNGVNQRGPLTRTTILDTE